jgi:hypothetical protein
MQGKAFALILFLAEGLSLANYILIVKAIFELFAA